MIKVYKYFRMSSAVVISLSRVDRLQQCGWDDCMLSFSLYVHMLNHPLSSTCAIYPLLEALFRVLSVVFKMPHLTLNI